MVKRVILHFSQKFKQFQGHIMTNTQKIQLHIKVWKKTKQQKLDSIINMINGKKRAIQAWTMISMAEKERVQELILNKNSLQPRQSKMQENIPFLKTIEVYWVQEEKRICQVLQTMIQIKVLSNLGSMMELARWETLQEISHFRSTALSILIS